MMMETLPSGTILHEHYRIERALGSGGFGHVYVAVDLRTKQQYALKEYLVTGSSGQAQLQHESRVLSQLHQPNLPRFQEAFNERGRYYVVLSYIEGSDLTDHIRTARQSNTIVPLSRILDWMLSICDAVNFLHLHNPPVIHRDIKPDNIRITPTGIAVLVDLGNAKATADGARTLFFIRHQGTPGYAPPEQYPGGSGTDVRSDVYALGGTLYFALTTREPPSVSARNQSLQQRLADLPSLQEQLANNPPEESEAANPARQFRLGAKPGKPVPRHSRHVAQLGSFPPGLLDQLNRIIQRAMAMKPNERYQSVADLSNDLRKVLQALPALTPPAGPSRPVDPHSTQPDLPFLYDAVQAAKEKQDQAPALQSPAPPAAPPAPAAQASAPPTPPSPTIKCPQCNAPLVPQATFCPRCGARINNISIARSSPSRPPPSSAGPPANPGDPKVQNSAQSHSTSSEPTLLVRPQSPQPPQAQPPSSSSKTYPPTPSSYASPSPSSRSAVQNVPPSTFSPSMQNSVPPRSAPPAPFLQSTPTAQGTPLASQTPPAGTNSPSTGSGGFTMSPKTIIITATILILLLTVLMILLIAKLK